ncbi:hypothetical protein KKD37_01595 [Patescibacteria group bacterium]|nr:hypothetical protein [Patescibacteria group bacterium]
MAEKLTKADHFFLKIKDSSEIAQPLSEAPLGMGIVQRKKYHLATSSVDGQPICVLQVKDSFIGVPTQHAPIILSKDDITQLAIALGIIPSDSQEKTR